MRTVLVVDDDADLRDILSEALPAEGFRVCEAGDGAEAFAILGRDALPDVILLDLGMPHMTGWQFRDLQKRDATLAHIPVVVITGTAPLGIDAAGVVEKPFEVEALAAKLRQVLGPERAALPRPEVAPKDRARA
jgi:CheY-like chemotaxis protein